jgi:RNA polymerase sigma-70 factor (ECF subfamily)
MPGRPRPAILVTSPGTSMDSACMRAFPGALGPDAFMNETRGQNVQISEVRLVSDAAQGVHEARRQLFERHHQAAFEVALRITGHREDALDVVQDGFIKAFDGLQGFQREAGFKTWLLRIVTNRALDLLRSRRVRRATSLDGRDGEEGGVPLAAQDASARPGVELERRELGERVARAVAALPAEQAAVFALFSRGEMTYGQIAEVLGIPIGTVMSRLFHARARLKEALADLDPGPRPAR